MNKIKTIIGGGIVASAMALGSIAGAAVTFDSATGTGFVGKGDVQLVFGWNNKQAQTNATNVVFNYASTDAYDVTCEWDTETGGKNSKVIEHAVTRKTKVSIASTVAYDARMKNQYTGYNLNGFTNSVTDGDEVPEVGDSCPMAHQTALVTEVAVNEAGTKPGVLTVTFGGSTVDLPNTPVVVTQ